MQQSHSQLPVASLLKPRAIALVGVSAKGGAGANILKSGARFGFGVPTWPVNPNADEIAGQRCYKSLRELPDKPDCVVIAVPADAVIDVVRDTAAAGIRAAYVVSEGFADAATDEGRARQAQARRACARRKRRARRSELHGPREPWLSLRGDHGRHSRTRRRAAAFRWCRRAAACSIRSPSSPAIAASASITSSPAATRPSWTWPTTSSFLPTILRTKVIACIMEGAKDGRRFRAAIERAARQKPIVVLKLGRSEFGQRATLAHTGTLAGKHEAFAALFRQNGVALVNSIDALVETAALLDLAPLPQGDRVVMMTVSGGATSLIGDLGEAAGRQLPADRQDDQRAHPENPRRRARVRQSARHGRAAAAAQGRQYQRGGESAGRGRRHRRDRSRARHARGRLGVRTRNWSTAWRKRRRARTSR